MAATSGNEWACFLKRVVFERRTLHAVTTPQPYASQLVSGERPVDARPFPPWVGDRPGGDGEWIAIHAARRSLPSGMGEEDADAANGDGLHGSDDGEAGGGLGRRNGLDVVELPRGAMVGIIHVRDAFRANEVGGASSAPKWIWQIDRAVSLKKPIRCAGFLGLWSISSFLTDLLVNAMHSQ